MLLVDDVLQEDAERVSTIGDAVFLTSRGPTEALQAIIRLFRRADRERYFPVLRAGVHHGEAVKRSGEYYGTAVNIAARVAARAAGGQILGTAVIATAARPLGVSVRSLGRMSLKNLREPVEVFSVEVAPHRAELVDPVCRMRVFPETAAAHLELNGKEHWFCSRECLRQFVGTRD